MTPRESGAQPHEKQGAISRFFADLFGSGEGDAAHYSEAVRRGNAVLSVTLANEARADEISELLEECGAVDVDERAEQWKASGYVPPLSAATMPRDGGDDVLKLVEEELKVGKRTVQQGAVRVHRRLTETPVEEEVSLRDERAVVERKKVDRPLSEAEMQTAFQDKDIEIRETSEEPVVSRTAARVVEEISVGKQSSERTETVRDTLRSTKADVESLGDDESADDSLPRFSGSERRMNSDRAYAGVERRASA